MSQSGTPRWHPKDMKTGSPPPPRPQSTSQTTSPNPQTPPGHSTLGGDSAHVQTDLLAEVKSTVPAAPPARIFASAASQPPSAPPPAAPSVQKAKPQLNKSSELTVIVDRDSGILALPLARIKARVKAAIAATDTEKLRGILLRGVNVLPSGRLLIAVDSSKTAKLLKQSAAHWVPRITKNSSLVVPHCQIVVNSIPTTLDPSSPSAAAQLYAHNRSVFSNPSVIVSMQWLNPKAVHDPKKKVSSLLVTISDVSTADQCIYQGLAVESTICYPHRYEEPPTVCYNCQQYGHTQHQCRQPSPIYARCTGPHCSSSCPTSSTKCAPGKRCEHFSPRCANCQGKHPSFHKECPVRVAQCELQRERLRGRIFFDPCFDPFANHHDDDAPFFFESTPSQAPPPASQ
ncbi:hypothetical protein C8F04DRAFT_1261740 [Mycena alexandri]|uniref:CCHC-type domain-containing protein n=1 Tax=Mycena alexandri TaxID=1745969 RepID=A0AAD6SSK1_9AGAR|nr:hypothetical protein C8F04DRAFT_1261740 [Mycena alexandri]